MKNIIIKTEDLCKTYASEGIQNHVLKNISLELYEGDFTVLMGASGSGKSTLLNLISKLDEPTSGDIYYKDMKLDKASEKFLSNFRRKEIGFVFQQPNLLSDLTVFENVYIPAKLLGEKSNVEIKEAVNDLLSKVEVLSLANRTSTQISGGEAQRVAIARALINTPTIVFADEPTGALNSATSKNVLDVFTNFNTAGQSMLVVTHDIKTALRANRILYLKDGVINGELNLDKYNHELASSREIEVIAWLRSLGW